MLIPFRHVKTVEPGLFCRSIVIEEQDIRCDGGVRREHAPRHPDNCMEVEILQQFFLDVDFYVISSEQEAVRQDNRGPPSLFHPVHDDGHKEVCRFAPCEIIREVALHVCLLTASIGRIHKDDVKLVSFCIAQYITEERVVMIDIRYDKVIKEQIRDAEHVRELLLSLTAP